MRPYDPSDLRAHLPESERKEQEEEKKQLEVERQIEDLHKQAERKKREADRLLSIKKRDEAK